jgi:hypothetical protein
LYRFTFHPLHALASSSSSSQLCELWHRRMAHLHHGALRLLREIVTRLPQFDIKYQKFTGGVLLGRTPRLSFRVVTVDKLIYLIWHTLMCAGPCH